MGATKLEGDSDAAGNLENPYESGLFWWVEI